MVLNVGESRNYVFKKKKKIKFIMHSPKGTSGIKLQLPRDSGRDEVNLKDWLLVELLWLAKSWSVKMLQGNMSSQ